jgi:hypothetical protein
MEEGQLRKRPCMVAAPEALKKRLFPRLLPLLHPD